jgi:FkbM family methyltransferase
MRYVSSRFRSLSQRLDALERRVDGNSAVFLGNNRLLMRCVVEERTIAYLLHADDLLFTPWMVVTGKYETALTRYFSSNLNSDSHCLDIGANFGFFTCLMARFCTAGRVVGVEPEGDTFALLRDNVAINGLHERATAVHAAAGEAAGVLTLHKRQTRSGNTSVARPHPGFVAAMGEEPTISFEVPSTTLDTLARDLGGRVDFIKIDVEGWEPAVLRGGREVIANNPQINIVMEWSPGQMAGSGYPADEVVRLIRSMGLTIRDIVDRYGRDLSDADLCNGTYRTAVLLSGPAAVLKGS